MKPRNYVARAQQSGAGKHRLSNHANRKRAEERRINIHEVEALQHNELHAQFFGLDNVPVREIQRKIDPLLRTHEIREIYNDKDEP